MSSCQALYVNLQTIDERSQGVLLPGANVNRFPT
jgi:hypothetical protein